MKDISRLAAECMAELDALGIGYRAVASLKINDRAKCRWGSCLPLPDGTFEISISYRLLADGVDDSAVKGTIIHELLHTVPGCANHGKLWQSYAALVNARYPQYNIKRTASFDEKGVPAEDRVVRQYTAKYKIVCTRCGACSYRKKSSAVILHPEKYRCGKCGGSLRIYAFSAPDGE